MDENCGPEFDDFDEEIEEDNGIDGIMPPGQIKYARTGVYRNREVLVIGDRISTMYISQMVKDAGYEPRPYDVLDDKLDAESIKINVKGIMNGFGIIVVDAKYEDDIGYLKEWGKTIIAIDSPEPVEGADETFDIANLASDENALKKVLDKYIK